MKTIRTNGITEINELKNSGGWYWGTDYASGGLYEVEELFRDGQDICCNRLIFLHDPDGQTAEPLRAKEGQYFGKPVYYQGQIYLLTVDFLTEKILIFGWKPGTETADLVQELPLSSAIDCYNLSLWGGESLMLLRQGGGEPFQLIWPEQAQFTVDEKESFCFRKGDRLWFSRWVEDPWYREEAVIRSFPSGEILEVLPGALQETSSGKYWLLR